MAEKSILETWLTDPLNEELARLDPGGAVALQEEGRIRIADGNGDVWVDGTLALAELKALSGDCTHEVLWAALRSAELSKCDGCGLPYLRAQGKDDTQGSRVCRRCQEQSDREDAQLREFGTLFPNQ